MPIYPQMFAANLQRNVQSLGAHLAQQQQRGQGIQDLILKAVIEQKIKQQDPLQRFLDLGKVAEAAQNMGLNLGDVLSTDKTGDLFQPSGMRSKNMLDLGTEVEKPEEGKITAPKITPTEFKMTPFGGWQPTKGEDIELKKEQQKQEAKIKAKAEVLKLSEKARANFGRSISLFSTMISQAKGMQEEQKEALGGMGIETSGLGLLSGLTGGFGVKTRRPWAARTSSFRGQMRETAIGLNSILTGQNRVIRSVVQMIQETLPDPLDPEPMMATKLAQSIMNAYKLVKSFEKAGLDPEKLSEMSEGELNDIDARSLVALYTLSSKEEKEIEDIIDDVLETPAMPKRRFGEKEGFSRFNQFQGKSQFKEGQTATNPKTGQKIIFRSGKWQTLNR